MKKQLKGLKSESKFKYFLKLNELDPVKILSMPNENPLQNSPSFKTLNSESFNESLVENIELNLEDYAKFSYII